MSSTLARVTRVQLGASVLGFALLLSSCGSFKALPERTNIAVISLLGPELQYVEYLNQEPKWFLAERKIGFADLGVDEQVERELASMVSADGRYRVVRTNNRAFRRDFAGWKYSRFSDGAIYANPDDKEKFMKFLRASGADYVLWVQPNYTEDFVSDIHQKAGERLDITGDEWWISGYGAYRYFATNHIYLSYNLRINRAFDLEDQRLFHRVEDKYSVTDRFKFEEAVDLQRRRRGQFIALMREKISESLAISTKRSGLIRKNQARADRRLVGCLDCP